MKTILTLVLIGFVALAGGCSNKEAVKAREDAAAKARADAAKKEMEALPSAFQSRDIFKKNEPQKPADSKTVDATTSKKP